MAPYPDIAYALKEGSRFLLRVVPVFALAVYAADLAGRLGWLSGLAWLAGPVMRLGRLSPDCGPGFVTSVVSPTAGHALLADLRLAGKLDRRELAVAAVVNNLPGEIATGKSVLPLALPVLGFFGAAYYGALLAASALKALLMLLAGRLILPPRVHAAPRTAPASPASFRTAARASVKPSLKTIAKVLKTMVPVAYIVYFLISAGFFDRAAGPLAFMTDYIPLNPAVLPVVAARLISPPGAYTVAGGLYAAGAATGWELVLGLFAGAFAATVTSLRYTVPYYFAIFGAADGTVIIAASMASRAAAYGAVLLGLILLIS